MTDAGDELPPARSASVAWTLTVEAPEGTLPEANDDRATRRAALRDLAAMIGVEVFY